MLHKNEPLQNPGDAERALEHATVMFALENVDSR